MGDKITVQVRCHSGYTYAERPQQILIDGEWQKIIEIKKAWRTPEGRAFRVVCADGQILILHYDEKTEEWSKK